MEQIVSNPLDDTGLCLLSLDGGGVRGLSTLHILKSLMKQLNYERQQNGGAALKPCELFDLIGGTSTGGLIAIMLGRLEMDVDECITAYNGLIETVFEEKAHRIPLSWSGRVQPRFKSAKLKAAIDKAITRQGHSPAEPFNDKKSRGCRVFVCTAAKDLYGITRLRSYDIPHKSSVSATISEAALATSAATGFFDSVSIGTRQFVDGALGLNNPVEQVEGEASDIWCPDTGEVKPLVKCFISIGTGNPGKKAIEDNLLRFMSKTLVKITTETEETAKRFAARWRQHLDQHRYFRLNVDQGLQDVGLAEYREQGRIEAATDQYLDDQHQISRVRSCVANLRQKQRKTDNCLVKEINRCTIHQTRRHSNMKTSLTQIGESSSMYLDHSIFPCHYIPLLPNKRFVGRKEVVEALRQWLFTSNNGPMVSLVGLGGMGKTQVAFQIAYWTKRHKPSFSVFWVSAMSDTSFKQAYTEISKMIAVRKSSENEDLRESVRRSLESKESGQWLLVVDNADDMDILFGSSKTLDGIFQYLPQNDNGRILFTTRFREVGLAVGGEVVELAEMKTTEAEDLLAMSLVRKDLLGDGEVVAELLQELTYLPLAITQAAAYLNRNRVTVVKYMELLRGTEQDVVGLMSREFQDSTRSRESRHAVATTWLVTFNQIQKSDPAAADLLKFLSCIEPKAVPQSILPLLPSEEAMVSTIGTLDAYAFLVQRGDTDMFDIHRLVHLATRIWVGLEDATARVERNAVKHVANVFPSSDYSQRKRWRVYLPHALRILRRDDTIDLEDRYDLCLKVGLCLYVDGRIKEAVQCLQECYDWRKKHFDENHPGRLASQHELARAYVEDGQGKKAVTLLEDVVRIREQMLEEDHPSRLVSQHTLALAYGADGQVKKAVTLLEDVVRIREQILEEDHPSRLASRSALAVVYGEDGQVKEAIALLEEVVQIQGQTLAEDHSRRLVSQHTLALAYKADGQVKKAVTLLEDVVRIKEHTLAANDPSRLASCTALAVVYEEDGQVKEAIALLEEVVRIRETLAEDDPNRLASQHALASAYVEDGQVKKAVPIMEEVLRVEREKLAEDDPSRLVSEHNLAIIYWDLGQHAEALAMMRHVVEVRQRVLDHDHPHRVDSETWLEHFEKNYKPSSGQGDSD